MMPRKVTHHPSFAVSSERTGADTSASPYSSGASRLPNRFWKAPGAPGPEVLMEEDDGQGVGSRRGHGRPSSTDSAEAESRLLILSANGR